MRNQLTILLMLALVFPILVAAGSRERASTSTAAVEPDNRNQIMRVEGERRFRANCSRCHTAPHKFPPRMMATIVRHMRVRATITDEDMKVILYYMTQ
jgi:mono/diheme cytochrome c family protein